MKKARRFTLLALIITLTFLILVGCNKKGDTVSSVYLKNYDPNTVIEIASGDFNSNAYTVVVAYESGRTEEIPLAEEMIAETDLFKLYQIGEHEITVSYGGHKYTFKVSVKRAAFEDLSFPENTVFTYDGKAHTVEVDGNIPANAVVTYPGGNSFVNVGTYDVTAVVSCEGYVTEKLTTTVKIVRAKYDMSGVKFEGKEFVYDGNPHSIAISGKLPEGVSSPTYTINEKKTSSATDVGEYTVKASFVNSDPNYEAIPEMVATLKITPAEYTVKGVDIVFRTESGNIISDTSKIYDGKSVTFDLNDYSKLSKKISVSFSVCDKDGKVISTSNKKTGIINAGVYTVKVEFTHADSKNYQPILPLVRSFEVLKMDHPPIENVDFNSAQTTYDGNPHSIAIEGKLPTGITVSYEYYLNRTLVVDSEGNPVKSVVDAGRYTVKAIFTHTDENRKQIPDMSATLNIEKAKVDTLFVTLSGVSSFEYRGLPYEFKLMTWKEANGKDYDILQYGTVKYYAYNGSEYVEMGENELPTEVGTYRITVDIEIMDSYKVNYCFSDGNQALTVNKTLEIQKKKIATPKVTFSSESTTVYNGNAYGISFSGVEESEIISVDTAYFKYDFSAGEYVPLENGDLPTNAGSYKFTVTVAINDTQHNVFMSGESSVAYSFEFEIKKKIIDINAILGEGAEYEYTGNDLRMKPIEDLDPEIKKYLTVNDLRVDLDSGGEWYETYSVSDRGHYRIYYYISVTDRENVALSYYATESYIVYLFHTFHIV